MSLRRFSRRYGEEFINGNRVNSHTDQLKIRGVWIFENDKESDL